MATPDIRKSYTDSWQDPDAFSHYDERREVVATALSSQISGVLTDHYPDGSVLLEIGAGNGAMSHYAGETTTSRFRWIETEQNPAFLDLSRSSTQLRVTATSAALPFTENSMDGVVGLSMLDTLSMQDLEDTAQSVKSVLKPGSNFSHLLDMSPDYMAEIELARANQEFPVPFSDEHNETMGLAFINIRNRHILAKISSLPIDPVISRTMRLLIEQPEAITALANSTGVLPYMGSTLIEYGLVSHIVPNWVEHFGQRLERVFSASGLSVIHNGIVNTTVTHSRSLLPPKYRPSRPNHVIRSQGVVSIGIDDLDIPKGQVVVEADAHLFVAEKPRQ